MKDLINNKWKFKTKEAKLILHSGIYIYFYDCQACSTTAVHADIYHWEYWLVTFGEFYGVFRWENSHRREFHTGIRLFDFVSRLHNDISRYLKVHFMLTKYTCDSKSQTLGMRYPFQSTGRPFSSPEPVVFWSRGRETRMLADWLHTETGGHFAFTWYGCEILYESEILTPRYKNRRELTPGWLAPAWHLVVVSCKQI